MANAIEENKGRPTHPPLTEKRQRAVVAEIKLWNVADGWATSRDVADLAGLSHTAIIKARKAPAYNLARLNGAAAKFTEHSKSRAQSERPPFKFSSDHRMAQFKELLKNWSGPIQSPLDGELYATPEQYLQHILDNPEASPDPYIDDAGNQKTK